MYKARDLNCFLLRLAKTLLRFLTDLIFKILLKREQNIWYFTKCRFPSSPIPRWKKVSRKFDRGKRRFGAQDRSAECLRIRRTEFTRRDWCLRDVAEIPRKYYAAACLRFACFVYRFAEEPSPLPPRDESWRTKREGGSRNEKAGNYNPVRLFFFLQTEDESREGSRSKWDVWNVSRKIFPSLLLPEKVRQFYASKIDGEIAGKRIWRISLYMIDLCFNKRILENIAIKNSKRDSIFLFFSKWKRTYIWTVYH